MPETSEIKGSNNSRGGMIKKNGTNQNKKMQLPGAHLSKIEGAGHFRPDIPGWDKPGTFIPVVSTT